MKRKNTLQSGDETGRSKETRRRPWPLDVRVALAKLVVESGVNAHEAATKLGVPYTTAVDWVARYRKGGEAGLAAPASNAKPRRRRRRDARHAVIVATKQAQPAAGSEWRRT